MRHSFQDYLIREGKKSWTGQLLSEAREGLKAQREIAKRRGDRSAVVSSSAQKTGNRTQVDANRRKAQSTCGIALKL